MAYRRKASSRTNSRRAAPRRAKRSAAPRSTRRGTSVRGRGTTTLRLVIEQPAANPIQRPIQLADSAAAGAPVMAREKSKF